jgi:hypothetical protein
VEESTDYLLHTYWVLVKSQKAHKVESQLNFGLEIENRPDNVCRGDLAHSVRGRPAGWRDKSAAAEGAEVRPLRRLLPAIRAEVCLAGLRDGGCRRWGGRAVASRRHGLASDSVAGRDHGAQQSPVVVVGGIVPAGRAPAARAPVKALIATPARSGTSGRVGQAGTGGDAQPHSTDDLATTRARRAASPILALVILPTVAELGPHGRKVLCRRDRSVAAIAALLCLGRPPILIVDNLPTSGLEDLAGDPGGGLRSTHLGDEYRAHRAWGPGERLGGGHGLGRLLPAVVVGHLTDRPGHAQGDQS